MDRVKESGASYLAIYTRFALQSEEVNGDLFVVAVLEIALLIALHYLCYKICFTMERIF